MKIRAAVLRADGRRRSSVTELELAPPGPGEVLVRLHASGVCHSDQNAIDGTADDALPGGARPRGRAASSRRSARA